MDLEGRFVVYQNMIEPDLRTGQQLIQMIHKSGIRFKGKVKRGVVSKSATILAEVTTPLPKVVSYMLKTSNNFYADLLVRNIAVAFGERPGTFQTGIDFLTFYLDHVNISRPEYSLNSGSGFSHHNTITPRAMVSLLKHLKNEKTVSPYFVPALPVAGVDGTLARRMKTTSPKGRVRAKTGYLRQVANKTHQFDGAVALAGYALSLKNQPYIFTFLYNGNAAPETVKTVFDKICEEVVGKLPVVKKAPPARKKKSTRKSTRKRSVRKS
jgi:D-alanyl-D-alanine carboxypeptidase/D-alanyl-D-alanine-endopeptidase (penicillin-binding protein 4)